MWSSSLKPLGMLDIPPPSLMEPKVGRAITADETKLKVNGRHLFVWAAIDVDSSRGRY